tara:strand:- start:151 stop:342 length:192 start_codon:yes stop_codon:yes gene_type:complete
MFDVIKDALGSDTTVIIKRDAIDELSKDHAIWDNLLNKLGYEHVDKTDNILELTIIGSNIYNE